MIALVLALLALPALVGAATQRSNPMPSILGAAPRRQQNVVQRAVAKVAATRLARMPPSQRSAALARLPAGLRKATAAQLPKPPAAARLVVAQRRAGAVQAITPGQRALAMRRAALTRARGQRAQEEQYGDEYVEDYGDEYVEDYGDEYVEDHGDEYVEDEGEDLLGFSFGKLAKSISRSVNKIDWNKVRQVAITAGPAIAVAFPQAAPFVQSGMAVLKGAEQGDPAAQAKIAEVQAGAAAGDPGALAMMQALLAARDVKTQVLSQQG